MVRAKAVRMTDTERIGIRLCILDLLVERGRLRPEDGAEEIRRMLEEMDDAQLVAFHEQVASQR